MDKLFCAQSPFLSIPPPSITIAHVGPYTYPPLPPGHACTLLQYKFAHPPFRFEGDQYRARAAHCDVDRDDGVGHLPV